MNIELLKEKLKDKKIISYIVIFLIIAFIWSNSLDNPAQSYEKSNKVLDFVYNKLVYIFGSDSVLTVFFKRYVRKIAHFTEYLFLGTAITSLMKLSGKIKLQHLYNSLSFSVIIAVIDEFIQIYTYRGSSVRDVIIDFSGYFTGTIIVFVIFALIQYVKRKKSGNNRY